MSTDVDDNEITVGKFADTALSLNDKPAKHKHSKGKKRKVEGESPKKSKKHKANT